MEEPTFLMPSGLRCRATSFSGLTTGIADMMLHIIRGEVSRMSSFMGSISISNRKFCLSRLTVSRQKQPRPAKPGVGITFTDGT
jgi:hypothetical protein